MGFFSSLGDAFGFGDSGAGDAAEAQQRAIAAATKTREEAFGVSEQNLLDILQGQREGASSPQQENDAFREWLGRQGHPLELADQPGGALRAQFQQQFQTGERGEGGLLGRINRFERLEGRALQGVEQGSTIGGFDQRLGDIFGSENFQNLRDERTRAVQGQLAAGGLTRSGTALREIANVPTQLGFDIENQQFGRQQGLANLAGNQFNTGFGQQLGLRQGIENLRQTQAGTQANLQLSSGQNEASGILAGRQAQAAGIGNLASLAGGIVTGGLSTIGQGATGFTGALGRFGRSF